MPGLHFDITGNNSDFLRKLDETQRGISQTSKRIESEGTSIENYFNKLAKGAATLGLGFSAAQLVKDIVEVRGQFQQLEIAFETMLKSKEKASTLMAQLTETAAKTPFDLQSVSQGAKQLLAYGTASEEVNDTLIRLGNIASGLSIPLGDLVYLYGTTQTQGRLFTQDVRQFMGRGIPLVKELAAELGKTEQQINEMVTAGKIGFPEVEKVIRNMTSENGQFYNLMEKQSASLTGQISNLGDAWDSMLNKIGTQTQGIASAGISAVTSLIENYEEVGVVLASLAASYGTYKAAIIVVNTLEKANIMIMRQAIIEKKLAAAANITLSNSMAIAAARGKMFALVQRNIMFSLKGLGSTLANPYVLLGAAVGAATYGLYKFYTRETEVEQMQRRYNDTKEAAVRRESEHKAKVDELINSLEDETTAQMDRVGAIEALKLLYPGIIEKYIDEEGHLRNLIALKKELAEFDATKKVEQNKTDLQSYDERIKNQEEYIDRMRTNDQSAFDDEVAKLEELKRQRELSRTNVAADYINKAINDAKSMSDADIANTINTYQKALSGNKNGEWFDTDKEFKVDEINRYISALKNLQTTRATAVHNKEYWTNQKKEAEKALEAIASAQKKQMDAGNFKGIDSTVVKSYKDNAKKLKEAEKELKVYDSSSKQSKSSDTLRKDQEKYNLLLDQQKREAARMKTDSQHELEQIEINGLAEGSEKVLKQRELNHKKELEAISREADDKKLKAIENARSAFESNPTNAKKTFDADKFVKLEPTKNLFASFDKTAEAKTKTENTKYNRSDDFKGLLDEYQDYTDKRLAIETKYNNDLATLEEQRRKAVENGDTQQIEQIDRAKAQATRNKGMKLMGLDYDKLKESPEYVRAFENLKETSSETLSSLLTQLENAKQTAAKVLSPDQLREYTTTIQEIMDELDSRNPFQSLSDKKKELAEAEQGLSDAQIALENALQTAEAVKGGAKIENGVSTSKFNSKTGKIESAKAYLTEAQALEKVNTKTNEYNKAKDNVVKQDAKVKKAEKDVFDIVEDLNNSIKELGDTIDGSAGEIISFIGDIGTFAVTTMNSIGTVSTKTVTAIQAVEKASVILGIISAAIQLMQKLESILPTADSQYEKYAAKLEEINKLTDAINEYKIAALEAQHAEEGWFSEDNLNNLRNYKELHDQVTEAYKDKASESQAIYQNKSGGGWFTNSWNWILDNTYGKIYGVDFARKYEEGQTAAINNLRIETRKRKKGFLGSGIGGKSQQTEDLVSWAKNNGLGNLFDEKGMINKESANAILNQYGDKLVGQTKETLESLIELREKYDEYIQQLHEYVSTLYEPLVDNFVDGIWDWLDSGKNALDSFKEYASDTFRDIVSDMMKTIALEKIFNNEDVWGKGESYQSKVSKVYEDYASGLIDEVELNKRVSELTQKMLSNAEAQLPAIQGVGDNILDTIYKTTGIDLKKSESSSQNSTQKGFEAISQDTGNELNGRFTALQISNEEIKNQMITLNQVTASLLGITQVGFNELVNLRIQANTYLEDIAGFQKKMLGLLNDIDSRLMRGVKMV